MVSAMQRAFVLLFLLLAPIAAIAQNGQSGALGPRGGGGGSGGTGCTPSGGSAATNLVLYGTAGACAADTNANATNGALTLGSSGTLGSLILGGSSSGTATLSGGTNGTFTSASPWALSGLVTLSGASNALGTPLTITLTNGTGLPLGTGVTGTLGVPNGGTGATSISAGQLIVANGTGAFTPSLCYDNGSGTFGCSESMISVPVSLTDAPTIAVSNDLSNAFYVTIVGNRTMGNPSTTTVSQPVTFYIQQDATGGRTMAWASNYYNMAGGAFTAVLNSAPNAVTQINCWTQPFGTKMVCQGPTIAAAGPTGSATVAPIITYDNWGHLTAVSSATITPAVGSITGLGTGVATALGNALNGASGLVGYSGALGTPTSGALTNATGLPISTGVSGLGTGIATALGVNTGSAGAPVLFNGAGGTPSSLTLTNATGLPNAGLATQTANTVLGALTATTPSGLALPSCIDTGGNHLNYTSGTGFSCGTTGGAASLTINSTGITSSTANYLLYSDGTKLQQETIASILTAGNGIAITGTTNATIATTAPNRSVASGGATIGSGDLSGQVNSADASPQTFTQPSSGTAGANTTVTETNQAAGLVTMSGGQTLNGIAAATLSQYGWVSCTGNGTTADCFGFPGFGTITSGALMKFNAANGSATAGDLSGDCTTSGSLVVTCAKASASVFGVAKVDGTTITASGGVISAVGGVATSITPGTTTIIGATAPCLIENSATTTMACAAVASTVVTAIANATNGTGGLLTQPGAAANLLLKSGGTTSAPVASSITDNGTTVSTAENVTITGTTTDLTGTTLKTGIVNGGTNAQSGTTYTLAASDCGKTIIATNASAITITTLNSLAVGCAIAIEQGGAGQITISAGSGATQHCAHTYTKTFGQWAIIGLFVDANSGGTAAVINITGDGA